MNKSLSTRIMHINYAENQAPFDLINRKIGLNTLWERDQIFFPLIIFHRCRINLQCHSYSSNDDLLFDFFNSLKKFELKIVNINE